MIPLWKSFVRTQTAEAVKTKRVFGQDLFLGKIGFQAGLAVHDGNCLQALLPY
jgi:hypothetical protein